MEDFQRMEDAGAGGKCMDQFALVSSVLNSNCNSPSSSFLQIVENSEKREFGNDSCNADAFNKSLAKMEISPSGVSLDLSPSISCVELPKKRCKSEQETTSSSLPSVLRKMVIQSCDLKMQRLNVVKEILQNQDNSGIWVFSSLSYLSSRTCSRSKAETPGAPKLGAETLWGNKLPKVQTGYTAEELWCTRKSSP
jgi:hypothetical protein